MGCINPDGTTDPAARKLLQALRAPRSPGELAGQLGLPMYRIRSGLRELGQAGLVEEESGKFVLTAAGRARVGSPA
jgi:predicted ArsR family transcriptional regulator